MFEFPGQRCKHFIKYSVKRSIDKDVCNKMLGKKRKFLHILVEINKKQQLQLLFLFGALSAFHDYMTSVNIIHNEDKPGCAFLKPTEHNLQLVLLPCTSRPSPSNTHLFSVASGGVRYGKTLETENKNIVWNDAPNNYLEDQIRCDQRLEPILEEPNLEDVPKEANMHNQVRLCKSNHCVDNGEEQPLVPQASQRLCKKIHVKKISRIRPKKLSAKKTIAKKINIRPLRSMTDYGRKN